MNKVTPLHILRPTQWEGKPRPERRWIVEGLIPRGAVTMLSGDGGLGKSLLTLQLLVAAATGGAWLGLDVAPCNGFGVYCEDEADELHRRLLDVCASNGTSLGELDGMSLLSRVGEANEFIVRDKYGKPKGPFGFL